MYTLREKNRVSASSNRVLERIIGPKRDKVTGEWIKLHNEKNELISAAFTRTNSIVSKHSNNTPRF